MNESPTSSSDPAALAEEVRSLANEAYRSRNVPASDAQAPHELSGRISLLQKKIDHLDADDLSLWLENLRLSVDPTNVPIRVPRDRPGPR